MNTYGYVLANPARYIDFYGLDTIDISINFRLPTFPGSPTIPGSNNLKPRGISIGIGFSYPGFYGGEFDIGILGSASVGDSFGLGTGKVTGSLTFSQGGIRDQRGISPELSFNDGIGGLAVGLDENNSPSSVGIHLGPGLEVAGDGKNSGSLSLRDGLDTLFDSLLGQAELEDDCE